MTLWDRKLGLVLLGLAFLTFACEEPGEIGLELNPENGVFVAKFNEISLPSSVILYEDILSDNSTRIDKLTQNRSSDGRLLTGSFTNGNFGIFRSKAFSSIYLSSTGFTPHADFVFDSLVLKVKVDYLYGENILGNKRIYVHELAEEIKIDSLYLTRNSTPYLENPLGEFNFDVSSFDTTRVDTVFSARLSDELGMRFLDEAKRDTMTFNNNNNFRNFFNGIALVSDESNEMVFGIHVENPSTFMRLYIHDTKDTTYFDLIPQGLDTTGQNITRYYNNISLDRSGTPLEGIPDYYMDYETDNDLTYIQASAGIFTKFNMGVYMDFLDTIENLVINRAELEIQVDPYNNHIVPSNPLDLYVSDLNNKLIEKTDTLTNKLTFSTVGRLEFTKDENENKGVFVGNVTNYIQELASGKTSDTLLMVGQGSLWNSVLSVNQTIIAKDKCSLKIYYSTLQ